MTNYKSQANYNFQNNKQFFVTCSLFIACNLWLVICSFADELRDIHPPVNYPSVPWIWWSVGILSAAIILATLWWLRQKKVKAQMPVSPSMKALKALETLLQQPPDHIAYLKLSSIVRQYLEDRFGLKVVEMTTEEFTLKLPHLDQIPSNVKDLAVKLLTDCDMVKFAKGSVTLEQFKKHCCDAVDIINLSNPGDGHATL